MKNIIKGKTSLEVNDYQEYIKKLYKNQDHNNDYIYGYMTRNINYLSKNISNKKVEFSHFIKAISWIFALANKLDINLQVGFMEKYPLVCTYCLTSPCQCHKTNKLPAINVKAWEIEEMRKDNYNVYKNKNEPKDLNNFIQTIYNIYPHNEIVWKYSGPWHHFYKLSEELAEIHEAYSKLETGEKSNKNVSDELSDILAWILSAWHIIFPNDDVDEQFIAYYYNGCQVCEHVPCDCKSRSDRAAELVDLKQLVKLKEKIKQLNAKNTDNELNFEDIYKALDSAIESQDEAITLNAVKETTNLLSKIKDTASNIKTITTDTHSITKNVSKIIDIIDTYLT